MRCRYCTSYFGNPFFSAVARWWFGVPVHDINCGMRGFTKAIYVRIEPRGAPFGISLVTIFTKPS